jgi:hypothetical protein
MKEGPEGKFLRNQLLLNMWNDADARLKAVKVAYKEKNETLVKLGEQFRAAMFLYDEVRQQFQRLSRGKKTSEP